MITHLSIKADIIRCQLSDLNLQDKNLAQSAIDFLSHAYAPYSKFSVSAAALLNNGVIVNGTNQENAASPSGTCAERTCLFYANSQYPDIPVSTIAIAAQSNGQLINNPITPCGACRQVILESEIRFHNQIKIILLAKENCLIINSIKYILPLSFDESFLNS